MTETQRGPRAPSLERMLREKSRPELSEYYSFWDGRAPVPTTTDGLVQALVKCMSDEESVRKRLKLLSKKLVDLLKFLLRDESYTATRDQVLHSRLFNYMSQYEVEAALNALQKRGFVHSSTTSSERAADGGGQAQFAIAKELGDVLHAFVTDEECQLVEMASLRAWLTRRFAQNEAPPSNGHSWFREPAPAGAEPAALVEQLCTPAEIAHRAGMIDDDLKAMLAVVIGEAGGFCPKALYERVRNGAPRWDRRRFKKTLEQWGLGTVRHLALGEYGINHFDDTVVVFDEVVAAWREVVAKDVGQSIADVKTCGVDLISDIASFLSFVAHSRVRLTLNGQIYRTVTKKLEDNLILARKPEFAGFDSFQYIYDFCVAKKLVQRRPDRSLAVTIKGRKWETDPLEKKLQVLLDFAFREPLQDGDGFHAPKLREQLLDLLRAQEVGRFIDVMALPYASRNLYLARLDAEHVRDAFQNRYQYAPTAVMRDAVGLAQSLFLWLRDRVYLLGLVDLGYRDGRPVALRLTPLGARALGRSLPADVACAGRPLVVNPDFEVLLFPEEGDTYDLITRLDRFAERQASDTVYRYKVTEASVEKAVAEGLEVSEILRVLSENARAAIPQNVVYSLKEWAGKVRFVAVRQMMVLRGKNREIMDRVLRTLSSAGLSAERLSPTAVVVEADADLHALEKDFAGDGVFLEGLAQQNGKAGGSANGSASRSSHSPHPPHPTDERPT